VIVCAFLLGCAGIAVIGVMAIASQISSPFGGFSRTHEIVNSPGHVAKKRFGEDWPPSVDPAMVQSVSCKSETSRDSYASWYRIQLNSESARKWMDHMHSKQEHDSRSSLHHLHEGLEGVRRTIIGPPPTRWQTGNAPSWWSPPSIEYRATEIMLWYRNYDSGVGRATYSAFEPGADTLWIYDYASQHNQLWSPGDSTLGMAIRLDRSAAP
jgi:hypothetical protein